MKKYIYIIIFLISGCTGDSKNYQDENTKFNKISITSKTTNNLCQVASYLIDQNFNGDFYLYDGKITWGMDVDSINIPKYFTDILISEKIEYTACVQGVLEFGYYPTKDEERGLLLNSKPHNPMITSGINKLNFIKLPNSKCLDFDWYYQTYNH